MNEGTLKVRKNVLRLEMPENTICSPSEIREDGSKSATNAIDLIFMQEEMI